MLNLPLLTDHVSFPSLGSVVGVCTNCGAPVVLRQPWLTVLPVVGDGWYLFHCTNKDCHNHSGMEVKVTELQYLDFVSFTSPYFKSAVGDLETNLKEGVGAKIIQFVPRSLRRS